MLFFVDVAGGIYSAYRDAHTFIVVILKLFILIIYVCKLNI